MSALSSIYFLNLKGDVLLARHYRDEPDPSLVAAFRTHVLGAGPSASRSHAAPPPVRQLGSVSVLHLRADDVHAIALAPRASNSNAMAGLAALTRAVGAVRAYCGGECTEAALRANFVLVLELLDEVADWGVPQVTDPAALKAYIFQRGLVGAALGGGGLSAALGGSGAAAKRAAQAAAATLQVTGAVGWRAPGIKYKRNEVFLDIVETVDALVSSRGATLRAEVVGRVTMKAFLSGMPDVKLGLNDRVEDVTFHPCVNLGRFNADRVAAFVPPDGEFELMRYRCADGVALPFRVLPTVTDVGRTRVEVSVRLKAGFDARLAATNVTLSVPVPPTTAAAACHVSAGKAKYDPKRGAVVWKMRRVAGQAEATLLANVDLVATTRAAARPWSRPPAALSFSLPAYAASGLRVQYLKVWEKGGYGVDKWVRKLCVAGDYAVRI